MTIAGIARSEDIAPAVNKEPEKFHLTEYKALKIRNVGPSKADGVIYFIDGLNGMRRMPDSFAVTYPFVYQFNNRYGWDVINAKFPNDDPDVAQSIPKSAHYVYERVKALKAQGYRKVVLAGHSWGGWVSMEVANLDAKAGTLDGLMMVAPAAYGSKVWAGKTNPYYLQNMTEYVRDIRGVRTPTVAVFFDGDDYDPGNRGDTTDAFLQRSHTPLLLIDRPKGLQGHGAGWLPDFADRFGACIDGFLKAPQSGDCRNMPQVASSANALPNESLVENDGMTRRLTRQDLAGRSFILTSPAIQVQTLKFGDGKVEVATSDDSFDADVLQDGNDTCIGDTCFRIYQTTDKKFIGFDASGKFLGWLAEVD